MQPRLKPGNGNGVLGPREHFDGDFVGANGIVDQACIQKLFATQRGGFHDGGRVHADAVYHAERICQADAAFTDGHPLESITFVFCSLGQSFMRVVIRLPGVRSGSERVRVLEYDS